MTSNHIKTGLFAIITLASLLYSVTVIFKIDWLTILNLTTEQPQTVATNATPIKPEPTKNPVLLAIEQEMAALPPIKPHTIVFMNEKIKNVKTAIKKGDYSAANQIATDYLNQSTLPAQWSYYPFDKFIINMKFAQDDALLDNLNKWLIQEPQSVIAHLLRARYYHDVAWQIRGGGFSSQVSEKAGQTFHDYLQLGKQDAYQAIKLNENNPYSYQLLLKILSSRGNSEEMEQAFQMAIKKFPDFYWLYYHRLFALQPKWGGSVEEMYQFTDRYAGKAANDSVLKFLYLNLYTYLLNTASLRCDEDADCVAEFMNENIKPHLTSEVDTALALYSKTDQFQFNSNLEGVLKDLIQTSVGKHYASTILQLAADRMGSQNQLVDNNMGHNHYVLDKMTALTWYYAEHYDNAEKKYKEALLDVEHATFPNEEEKILAIANIYNDLSAYVYETQSQFAKVIAYQNAIVALTGDELANNVRCRTYFTLKLYQEALQECTDRIKQQNSFMMEAYYYRAWIYKNLGQQEAALNDFLMIADSDDLEYRASAIINASVIYGSDFFNDPTKLLAHLNKYPYLFDEKQQINDYGEKEGKHNLSIGYNNRCYAYMQLGDYQKALDDCTNSLKYDNLPDAYQKQQELIKKLTPSPTKPSV